MSVADALGKFARSFGVTVIPAARFARQGVLESLKKIHFGQAINGNKSRIADITQRLFCQ